MSETCFGNLLLLLAGLVKDSPGGRGLSLHLLTVPHFNRAVVGRRCKDGVFVRDPDAVHGGFVFMKVGDQQTFGVPP